MLEPTGPLPPEIYWRRRALAIGAAVVVLGLIVWFIASLVMPNPKRHGYLDGDGTVEEALGRKLRPAAA